MMKGWILKDLWIVMMWGWIFSVNFCSVVGWVGFTLDLGEGSSFVGIIRICFVLIWLIVVIIDLTSPFYRTFSYVLSFIQDFTIFLASKIVIFLLYFTTMIYHYLHILQVFENA